ncbi:hypothetical protein T01_1861 [Trichinella spiralis]|uniref:Uncharacterized protein n=1 Tax=Trichinella spiralis TaxID=6334 RepID=A0A0V1APW5_TRISP|nr:hypothetical protein T01_613 [Trichinella spiralis]KRY26910.1 hypothetical protein T01_1861 [Trichinella spiralis]
MNSSSMEIEKETPGGCSFLQQLARPDVQHRINNTKAKEQSFLTFDKKKAWLFPLPKVDGHSDTREGIRETEATVSSCILEDQKRITVLRYVLRACCCCWFEKFGVTYRRWSLFIVANKHYTFCLSSDEYNVIRKARRMRKEKQCRRKPAEVNAQGNQPVDIGSLSISDECANNLVGMTNEPTRERVSYRPNDVCQLNNADDGQSVNPDKAGCR